MASNYPGALDSLANPAGIDQMTAHAEQHSNANDAIEAIQGELGTDPAGGSATVRARLDALDTTVGLKADQEPPAGGTAGQVLTKDTGTDYDYSWQDAAGGGGVSDHGALTGLGDDDHTQYHNDTRGDARYYTQAQVDSSLASKSDTSHSHGGALNPAGGSAGQVLKKNSSTDYDYAWASDAAATGALAALDTVGTPQIDNDAVTYDKLQNVSATDRFLGRDSAGAGTVEEITAAAARTILNVEDGADVTDATNVSAAGAPIISSGAGVPASTPSKVGDIYIDTTNDDAYIAVGTASSVDWERSNDGAGSGSTDLSWTASTRTVASSSGNDAVLTEATTTDAGLMSSGDKTKLDGVETGADVTDAANVAAAGAHMSGGTDVPVADGGTGASTAATARTNLGLVIGTDVQAYSAVLAATTASFTTADETKLDGIATAATANPDAADMSDSDNAGRKISVTSTAPTSPSTGDVWIDIS